MSNAVPPGYEPVFNMGFNAYVGPILCKTGGNETPDQFLFDVRDHHLNGGGYVHGGMLMALADVVLGVTAHHAAGKVPCATVSLNCDFVAVGKSGDRIEGEAHVTRKTRSVLFLSGELYARTDGSAPRKLLTATGIWKVLGA